MRAPGRSVTVSYSIRWSGIKKNIMPIRTVFVWSSLTDHTYEPITYRVKENQAWIASWLLSLDALDRVI